MYAPCATAKDAAKPHALPAVPLDAYSYTNGRLVDIRQAHIGKGWQLVAPWTPRLAAETRPGFVDVPMLETNRPGAKLTLDFEGTAVGIFCVSGRLPGYWNIVSMVPHSKSWIRLQPGVADCISLGCICSIRSYRWENIA